MQLLIQANPDLGTTNFLKCLLEIRDDPVSVNCIMGFARVVAAEFSLLLRDKLAQLRSEDDRSSLRPLYKHPMYVRTPYTRIPCNILASIFESCRQFTDTRDTLTSVFGSMVANLAFPLIQMPDGDTWALVRQDEQIYLAPRRLVTAFLKTTHGKQFDRVCLDPDGVQFLLQFLPVVAWSPQSNIFQELSFVNTTSSSHEE